MKKSLCFVYGTLKQGERNNCFLSGQKFLRKAKTKPRYRLYDLGCFPAMVADLENGRSCEGELWEVDENTILRMDCLEGHPFLYKRQIIDMEGVDEAVESYIYQWEITRLKDCSPSWCSPKNEVRLISLVGENMMKAFFSMLNCGLAGLWPDYFWDKSMACRSM